MGVSLKANAFFGFLFGVLLLVAQIDLSIGLPIMFLGTALYYSKYFRLDSSLIDLKIVLIVKIIWIFLIWLTFKTTSMLVLGQTLAVDLILLSLLFFRIDQAFIKNLAVPLAALLLADFLFNLSIYIFGVDPLGRGGALRPGDIIPRVGGLFGNPFYTVDIAVVGIFCGFILRSRSIFLLSVANLLINGTFKSPLALISFFLLFYATKYQVKLGTIIFASVIFAAIVFGLTVYSAGGEKYGGNTLRVVAYINAIDNILQNPIFGTHTFRTDPREDMSADIIVDYGIAESP